jgi:hypothetical protein
VAGSFEAVRVFRRPRPPAPPHAQVGYGLLVDRLGPRRCALLCCALLAAACLLGSGSHGP